MFRFNALNIFKETFKGILLEHPNPGKDIILCNVLCCNINYAIIFICKV